MSKEKVILILSGVIFILLIMYYVLNFLNIRPNSPIEKNIVSDDTTQIHENADDSKNEKVAIQIRDDTVFLNIDAYHESCLMDIQPIVSIFEKNNWITIKEKLPHATSYYLDEKYYEYDGPFPMCDMVGYWKIKSPVEVKLPKYTYISEGVIEDTKNKDTFVEKFVTKEYRGDVKIELEYCTNSTCDSKELFTAILNESGEILSTETTSVQNP